MANSPPYYPFSKNIKLCHLYFHYNMGESKIFQKELLNQTKLNHSIKLKLKELNCYD